MTEETIASVEGKKKKIKKHMKPDDYGVSEPTNAIESNNSKKSGKRHNKIPKKKKKDVKSSLKLRKEKTAELLKIIPRKNEDGISFTKFQIRQMTKRVKKGLPPIASPHELEEKRRNEARLRREEEAELAGLVNRRISQDTDEDNDNPSKSEEDNGASVDNNSSSVEDNGEKGLPTNTSDSCSPVPSAMNNSGTMRKKTKQGKPVPYDYICQACKNRHTPAHWIYDCPEKVTVRCSSQKKKRERGIKDPDSKKVFVSGLPFDAKAKAVEDFFSIANSCGTIAFVRLVKFDDTERCNGQAFISFDTNEGAQRAIELSGTNLDVKAFSGDKNTRKKRGESRAKRKELKLKVSKVLNRRKTKQRRW